MLQLYYLNEIGSMIISLKIFNVVWYLNWFAFSEQEADHLKQRKMQKMPQHLQSKTAYW